MITIREVEVALEGSEYSIVRHLGDRTKYVFIGDRHEQNDELTADFMRKTGNRISTIFLEGAKGTIEYRYRKNDFRLATRFFSYPFEGDWCPNGLIRNLLRADSNFFRAFLERGGRIKCNDHKGLLKQQRNSAFWLRWAMRSHDLEEQRKFVHIAHERSKKMIKALLRDRGALIMQVVGYGHLDDFWHSHFADYITVGRPEDFARTTEARNATH